VRFRITISNLQSQVTAFVRNYIAENDQYCLGGADDGPNSQKATGYLGADCWPLRSHFERSGRGDHMYSIFVTPAPQSNFTFSLYSDDECRNYIGTYGLLNSAGDCIYNGATPFRSYTFNPRRYVNTIR
jgi:hypothetical protein